MTSLAALLLLTPVAWATASEVTREYSLATVWDCAGLGDHATGANRVCFDVPSGAQSAEYAAKDISGFRPRLLIGYMVGGEQTYTLSGCTTTDSVPAGAELAIVDVHLIEWCDGLLGRSQPGVNAAGTVTVIFS